MNTRRKSMRDALVCWIVYVSRQHHHSDSDVKRIDTPFS